MAEALLRSAANDDLLDIPEYIARDAPAGAEAFIDHSLDRRPRLAEIPGAGRAFGTRHRSLRMCPFRPYVILYRPPDADEGIDVLRVVHAARDWLTLLD